MKREEKSAERQYARLQRQRAYAARVEARKRRQLAKLLAQGEKEAESAGYPFCRLSERPIHGAA